MSSSVGVTVFAVVGVGIALARAPAALVRAGHTTNPSPLLAVLQLTYVAPQWQVVLPVRARAAHPSVGPCGPFGPVLHEYSVAPIKGAHP